MSHKVRTKINISFPAERVGAISASEASSTSQVEEDYKKQPRPKTHEGFKPTAPSKTDKAVNNSGNAFLSPRQVSVKLVREPVATVEHFLMDDGPEISRELSLERDPRDRSRPLLHQSYDSQHRSIESQLPTFIKKSFTPVSSNSPQMKNYFDSLTSNDANNTHNATVRTAYPSLGTRLNATISTSRPNTAVQSSSNIHMPINTTKTNKLVSALVNNNPQHSHAMRTANSRPSTGNNNRRINTSTKPAQQTTDSSFDFHSELEQTHMLKTNYNTNQSPDFQQQQQQLPYFVPEQDNDGQSTVFDGMAIEDILDYLLEARETGSRHAPFIHVTSRYHVDDSVRKTNFYDLVILERPGNPKSGEWCVLLIL